MCRSRLCRLQDVGSQSNKWVARSKIGRSSLPGHFQVGGSPDPDRSLEIVGFQTVASQSVDFQTVDSKVSGSPHPKSVTRDSRLSDCRPAGMYDARSEIGGVARVDPQSVDPRVDPQSVESQVSATPDLKSVAWLE